MQCDCMRLFVTPSSADLYIGLPVSWKRVAAAKLCVSVTCSHTAQKHGDLFSHRIARRWRYERAWHCLQPQDAQRHLPHPSSHALFDSGFFTT